jgi:pimeloyl-ACP methyl ester carboxylesterase
MPFARSTDGGRVHYEVHGDDGPWVVLLMGLGAPSQMWLEIPRQLRDRGYRVLTMDNRGTGRSDPLRRPVSLRSMADDVAEAMDAASADRAIVVGTSMGGMIAQHTAIRHGRRLSGLVLLATTPGLPHGQLPTPRAVRALLVSALGTRMNPVTYLRLIEDLVLSPADRARAVEIADRMARAALSAPRTPPASFLWQLLACTMHSTGRHLGRITTPTIVVAGSDDIVMGVGSARVLARRIPNAELDVVPDTGHGITFTRPEAVLRAVARLAPARTRPEIAARLVG